MEDGGLEGPTHPMVVDLDQPSGEVVGQAAGMLMATTTSINVSSQTEDESGQNSFDSLGSCLTGAAGGSFSSLWERKLRQRAAKQLNRKRKKTSSMGEQFIYSGAFYRTRRLTSSNSNEARSCMASMAVRSGLTYEVPLPFSGVVLPGTLPFTVFPLAEELARLGFETSQLGCSGKLVNCSEQLEDSGLGLEGMGPLEGEEVQQQQQPRLEVSVRGPEGVLPDLPGGQREVVEGAE